MYDDRYEGLVDEAQNYISHNFQTAADSLSNFPGDIQKMVQGFMKIQEQTKIEGPTAYLKSTLYDMLGHDKGRDYLHAKSVEGYKQLHQKSPKPLLLTLPQKPWMKDDGLPCKQDWFFAHLQVSGFNTTMLAGVKDGPTENKKSMTLADLQAKMPLSDLQFQRIVGDNSMSPLR